MYFYTFSFSPQVIQYTLHMIERWRTAVEITNYEILVELNTFLEYTVWNGNPRSSSIRYGNRSKPTKGFILRTAESFD